MTVGLLPGNLRVKDKEALFNVAYNVSDNISSQAILRHSNYVLNTYLPYSIFLAQPLLCKRQLGSYLLVPFFTGQSDYRRIPQDTTGYRRIPCYGRFQWNLPYYYMEYAFYNK